MSELPFIVVAEEDYNRLTALIERMEGTSDVIDGLEEELSRADLKPSREMPENVVTMNSRVRFLDEDANQEHEMTLVYPHEVGEASDRVSILAPAGAAMLGLGIGDRIEWPMKGRKPIHLKVVGVTRAGA
ncbi:regulator of nucleoside diphosphate kinase [Marinobacter persicus]|uniref:Regulator of nucleoside diphosphate kinase n=1 Tax=Marinobacter persicus TaxID=930118 RepID=A0A1I3S7L1_9GAMM|nr:nucleoside diphosphate kinase regulator [Marinobacter persicus]GHD45084.1 regulator of nucleoside diphosphate kinase [Marinobacter persicus]SFJ54380.1 regulator of nucleoside diphosphate kinase [Marinobacter persicus]